ncbi:MAG: hypothetical protein ACPG5B_04655 [Chitinophagales bacterium]
MLPSQLIDFIIGFGLANALPHFIFGITKTRFLGLFGFSPKGNIFYAYLCATISFMFFIYQYGFEGLTNNLIYTGGFFILICYFLLGKFLYLLFQKK